MSATTIKSGTITGDLIAGTTITAGNIAANAVNADKINVTDLATINANMGTITAGKMESSDGKFVIDLSGKFISITV
jgi:cytoskeletal protein CcmA (bactofilin family)